jgi:hypothetical protein
MGLPTMQSRLMASIVSSTATVRQMGAKPLMKRLWMVARLEMMAEMVATSTRKAIPPMIS